jgi:predicted MFS family arabinose efflux permease
MQPKHQNDYLIIAALWLLMFSATSQLMIISPILPRISIELNIPEALSGTLITAYAVMLGVFALVIGPISDKIGRRKILMMGSGAMSLALFLHYFAFDYTSMMTVRAVAGCAGGMLTGSTVSYVGDYFPYDKRGWANGWISTGMATGSILGIPMGTLLAEWFGFRGPFTFFAFTMFGAFLLIWLFVPQPNVRLERSELTPLNVLKKYWAMLAATQTRTIAAIYGLTYLGLSLFIVYWPTWLTDQFGVTGYEIASLFFVGGVASILSGPRAGKLSDRIGRKSLIIGASLGICVMMIFTTFIVREFWISYIYIFLFMSLMGARLSPFQALISEIVPAERRGSMMSLTIALGQIGMGLGGVLSGLTYSKYGYASNTILAAISVLMMVLLLKFYIVEPPLKTSAEQPQTPPAI